VIQRLLDVLHLLAAEPEVQLTRAGGRAARPAELAGELADTLLLVDSCQQESVGWAQRESLEAVEQALERLCADAGAWNEQAVRGDPRWAEVRRRAALALRELGRPG
jgi:hypothetical protein